MPQTNYVPPLSSVFFREGLDLGCCLTDTTLR